MKHTRDHASTRQTLRSIQTLVRFAIFSATFLVLVGAEAFAQTAPTATITVLTPTDKVNEPAVFKGTCSAGLSVFDDGYVNWDFGDGFKASISRATHVYRAAGTYTVTLTIKCGNGQTATTSTTVTVSDIPAATASNTLCVGTTLPGCSPSTTFSTIQAAINQAATTNVLSGPVEIILPAGQVFDQGVVTLTSTPATNKNYITIKSSQLANLPQGKRVDRSAVSSNFATILAPFNISAVRSLPNVDNPTSAPSHHYRFQGIQFKTKTDVDVFQIVEFGLNATFSNAASKLPHHIIIDRCLFYSENLHCTAQDASGQCTEGLNETKFGILFNTTKGSIVDSYFSNINRTGTESHAITVDNTVGILGFINNYLEAGSIPILFGGSVPNIPGGITRDVEFRRNRCHKPLAKRALTGIAKWHSKNNFEIKSGQYFVIEGNLFDTSWKGEDQRYIVNLRAASDSGSQAVLKDIQFTSNKLKQGPNGFLISGFESGTALNAGERILIKNNLIEEISSTYATLPDPDNQTFGQDFIIANIPKNLVIRHNTLLNTYALIAVSSTDPSTGQIVPRSIIFNDNIGPHSQYGIWGSGYQGDPSGTIDTYFLGSSSSIYRNTIAGGDPNEYPAGNDFLPANVNLHFENSTTCKYCLKVGAPGKGTASEGDGSDVGANFTVLEAATKGVISGDWTGGIVGLEDVVWINLSAGATANGNDLTKFGATAGWSDGAISSKTLSGNGYVEFSTDTTNTGKACGLNSNHVGHNYTEIDYVITLGGNGYVRIYENGTAIPEPGTTSDYLFGTYAAGDVFRVEINNGMVKYYWNGALMTERTATSAGPYVVDTSLTITGAKITNAVISGAWSN